MNKFAFFCFALFALGCSSNKEQEYPDVILEHNLQGIYDIAKFEIYKNSSNKTCSCSGFFFASANKNDTLSILSCDLSLDTIFQSSDTTTMFFSYITHKKEKVYYINNLHIDCFHCIGIQFIREKLNKAYFAEDGYLLYDEQKDLHVKDSLFLENINTLGKSLKNSFLQKYETRNKQ